MLLHKIDKDQNLDFEYLDLPRHADSQLDVVLLRVDLVLSPVQIITDAIEVHPAASIT